MSTPSDNSTVSSSGRSSPDDANNAIGGYFPRRASTPAQSFLPPRFWAHNSAGGGSINTSNGGTNSNNTYDQAGGFAALPRRTSFGTTFSNGGRFSALTALGMSPSSNPALYGIPSNNSSSSNNNSYNQELPRSRQQSNPGPQKSSMSGNNTNSTGGRDLSPPNIPLTQQRSRTLFGGTALVTTPEGTPTPSMPSSPVQKPRKRSVCLLPGPDGLCVEARGRRGSQTS